MRERVIQGSDDESEDFDELNDEQHDMASVLGEDVMPQSQSEFQAMMEQASQPHNEPHTVLDGVEIRDLTGTFSLEGLMEASNSRRSRTTMETLRTTSYQNRGNYGSTRYDGGEDAIHGNASLIDARTPTDHHSSRSAQQDSSQVVAATTSMQEDFLPSSREIFPVGSTLLPQDQVADQSFNTQTTIPFTMTGPVRQSPMVVIPAGPLPSSGVLAGEINDIADYLQHDIANASILNKSVSGELPSTDPPMEQSGPLGSTVEPSNLLLQNDASDILCNEHGIKSTNIQSAVAKSIHGIKSSSHTSKQVDERSSLDEAAIGVPKEMYKPRPSRSRAKRTHDDLDLDITSSRQSDGLSEKKKVKRRKTAGDTADDPLSLDDDLPTSFSRRTDLDAHRNAHYDKIPTPEAAAEEPSGTVEVSLHQAQDVPTSQDPGETPDKSAKKKRGRPRKSQAKSKAKSKAKPVKTLSQSPSPRKDSLRNSGVSSTEAIEAETRTGKKPKPKRSSGLDAEDSEDELAVLQPGKKPQATEDDDQNKADSRADSATLEAETRAGEPSTSTGAEHADAEADEAQLPKKSKRGRKPKRKSKAAAEEDSAAVEPSNKDQKKRNKDETAASGGKANDTDDLVERQNDNKASAGQERPNGNKKEEEEDNIDSEDEDLTTKDSSQRRQQQQRRRRRPLENKAGGVNAQPGRSMEATVPADDAGKGGQAAATAGGETAAGAADGPVSPTPVAQTPQTPSAAATAAAGAVSASRFGSPIPTGKVPYRVGLSRRSRIEPLLKIVRRQ